MQLRFWITVLASGVFPISAAAAGDGVFEINQICAQVGCFPGDAPLFPVTIASPGSYRLTGDLLLDGDTGPGGNAIVIAVNRVTLDLNGFSVRCASARGACHVVFTDGIKSTGNDIEGIAVRNGRVEGFGGAGIFFLGMDARVENVAAALNSGSGIRVGRNSAVMNCKARDNNDDGIDAGDNSVISGNVVQNSGIFTPSLLKDGIVCGNHCVVAQNTSSENAGDGLRTGLASVVRDNSVYKNAGNGISASSGSTVTANAMRENGRCGLRGGGDTGYANNTMTHNNGNNVSDPDANREVVLAIQTGSNVCGNNTNCAEGAANSCL